MFHFIIVILLSVNPRRGRHVDLRDWAHRLDAETTAALEEVRPREAPDTLLIPASAAPSARWNGKVRESARTVHC